MIEVKIDSGDLQKVIKRFDRMDKNVQRGIQREINHSALAIQRIARTSLREQGAIATGRLRSSVNIRYTNNRMGAVIGTNVDYAGNVEFGQKPGRWPNVGDLMRWVRTKITRNPKEVRRAAYLIGRKIFQKGTDPKPFMQPAADRQGPLFIRNIKRVLKMA